MEEEILSILRSLQKDMIAVKEALSRLPKQKMPLPLDFNPMGKKRCLSQRLRGGLKDPKVRDTIVRLRKDGQSFEDIASYLRANWPNQPEKHIPGSTIHRFWQAVLRGRTREFGLFPPIDL